MDILKWFRKGNTQAPPEVKTKGYHGGGRYGQSIVMPWTRSQTRRKVEEDLIKMDENDGIVARILDHIANYATCFEKDDFFGVKVVTGEAPGDEPSAVQKKSVDVINKMMQRTDLNGQSCWDIVRDMVRKGNVFTETVISEDMTQIDAVRQFQNSWQIEKNVDDSGNLRSGDPQVAMNDPRQANTAAYTQINDMGSVVAAFWPYQIVHWGFGPLAGGVYHKPMGEAGIVNWKRLNAGLDSLGVARIIRCWDANIHVIPMPAGLNADEVAEKVREYQENNETDQFTTYDASSGNFQSTPRNAPTDVARDYYMPAFYTSDGKVIPGDIKKLQPSTAALSELGDIELAIGVLICTWGMPIEILGLDLGNKPMVDKTKEEGMEAFSKQIKRLQFSHAIGLKTLFDLELLLHGINPLQPLYKIKYPSIIPQTAETEAKIMMTRWQAATYQASIGMPPELIGPEMELDARQIEIWKKNLEAQVKATQALAKTQISQQPKPKE